MFAFVLSSLRISVLDFRQEIDRDMPEIRMATLQKTSLKLVPSTRKLQISGSIVLGNLYLKILYKISKLPKENPPENPIENPTGYSFQYLKGGFSSVPEVVVWE